MGNRGIANTIILYSLEIDFLNLESSFKNTRRQDSAPKYILKREGKTPPVSWNEYTNWIGFQKQISKYIFPKSTGVLTVELWNQ